MYRIARPPTSHRARRALGGGGALAVAALLLGASFASLATADTAADTTMRFGMDVYSIDALQAEGIPPAYGVFWVGPWNLPDGWGWPERDLQKMHDEGVTPVIQFYYWGDSISPTCFEQGCDGKTQEGWQDLAEGLATRLNTYMDGKPVVIVLETEFNKGGIEDHEPFDQALAEKARYFESAYPASVTVLGFGNWGQSKWGNMDQTMAAVDAAGLQAMRGSTRHTVDQYLAAADKTLTGAQTLQNLFGKPVYVTDIALSSYPEPEWLTYQDQALQAFFGRMGEFQAAGVTALIYRSIADNPDFDTANYFGEGERHWGLTRADGTWKPAMTTWVNGVKAYGADGGASEPVTEPAPTPTSTDEGTTTPLRFVFLSDTGDVDADGVNPVASTIREVCARDGCAFVVSAGDNIMWAGPDGAYDPRFDVQFEEPMMPVDLRFYMSIGNHDSYSADDEVAYHYRTDRLTDRWYMPDRWYAFEHGNVQFVALDTNVPASSAQTTALRDTLASTTKDWRIAFAHHPYVSNGKHGNAVGDVKTFLENEVCGKVDVYLNGHDHAFQWPKETTGCDGTVQIGTTAVSDSRPLSDPNRNDMHYQKGDIEGFTWIEIDGATLTGRFYDGSGNMLFEKSVTKDGVTDGGTSDGGSEPAPEPEPTTRTPTWALDDDIGTHWVEVYMTPDDAAAVHASVDDGTWHALTHRSWGSWASATIAVPDGASVRFRATWSDGATALSPTYTWPSSTATIEPEPAPAHDVTWVLDDDISNSWVETYPASDASITGVHVVVDGTATALGAKSWGSWAKAMQVPTGASVHFRATFSDGTTADSPMWSWLVDTDPTHVPPASSGPTVTWTLDDDIGRYWVEVYLDTSGTLTDVDARVDGGSWKALEARSWGSWAKSFHVPAGSHVTFRATFNDGATVTSGATTWP